MRILSFVSAVFILTTVSQAQLSGPISGTLGPGPYTVIADISVSAGDSLIILPGTTFLFNGFYGFTIHGYLYAAGTESDSIRFEPAAGVLAMNYIYFTSASDDNSIMEYCVIRKCENRGLNIINCNPTISRCTISECYPYNDPPGGGMYIGTYANPLIINCLITDNYVTGFSAMGGGIKIEDSSMPTIVGCTIANNSTNYGVGGGVACWNTSGVIIQNCLITGNSSISGGGIYIAGGEMVVENCQITGNSSNGNGGGITTCAGSNSNFIDCNIHDNSAQSGGGGIVLASSANDTFQTCTFSNNQALARGGGIYCYNGSEPSFIECTIQNNTSIVHGGAGLYSEDCAIYLEYCFLSGNQAGGSGGGTFIQGGPTSLLRSCTYLANYSAMAGGGIYAEDCAPIIDNCVMTGNSAVGSGGAINLYSLEPNGDIRYCTLSQNSSNICGGGICIDSVSFMNLDHNEITVNSAPVGGGLACINGQDVTVESCVFEENSAFASNGGGIYTENSDIMVQSCYLDYNSAEDHGGGIYCTGSAVDVMDTYLLNGNAGMNGGAFAVYENSEVNIEYCEITSNIAQICGGGLYSQAADISLKKSAVLNNAITLIGAINGGGGFYSVSSTETIENCTFNGNISPTDGGGLHFVNSITTYLRNTIVTNSMGFGGVTLWDCPHLNIEYSDFYNNENGDFTGYNIPPELGQIVQVNTNGDSCDLFSNIFLQPQFTDPWNDAFYLQANSPCIDAGAPFSQFDPDSTIADIGAFYFDQNSGFNIILRLNPQNPPIIIPPGGGNFFCSLRIENLSPNEINFDGWTEAILPDSSIYSPIFFRANNTIAANSSFAGGFNQVVPASALPGIYCYICKIGVFPDSVIAADCIEFEKIE